VIARLWWPVADLRLFLGARKNAPSLAARLFCCSAVRRRSLLACSSPPRAPRPPSSGCHSAHTCRATTTASLVRRGGRVGTAPSRLRGRSRPHTTSIAYQGLPYLCHAAAGPSTTTGRRRRRHRRHAAAATTSIPARRAASSGGRQDALDAPRERELRADTRACAPACAAGSAVRVDAAIRAPR